MLVERSTFPGRPSALPPQWAGPAICRIALRRARRRPTRDASTASTLGGVLFAADSGLGCSALKHTTIADVARRRRLAGPDGPDRLVGDDHRADLILLETRQPLAHLQRHLVVGDAGLALVEGLAATQDRRHGELQHRLDLLVHRRVGLAED